ncbi:hypothetical protein C8F04DRAFT_1277595 [Mycena alexandri]|uniref:Uncharacterized protein n=1 Tax=Mycena alexandri TaxID=1745969 RepID=A0AAD6WP51_9AGAR|nr:hypothetical protein C8F04DRAFT_1277595 [Mycena alexandri]
MLPSPLENMLAYGDERFVLAFFEYWDPPSIFLLGMLNFRLRNLVHHYRAAVWNVPKFLSGWFRDPEAALVLLAAGPGLFCGPGVLQFLDRSSTEAWRLDLCVGYSGLVAVGKFLGAEGYNFRPGNLRIRDFDLVAIMEAAHFPDAYLKMDGDRSSTQDDHASRTFRFVKIHRGPTLRVVVVHLLRCELHRFVFSMHSSNYIASEWFTN